MDASWRTPAYNRSPSTQPHSRSHVMDWAQAGRADAENGGEGLVATAMSPERKGAARGPMGLLSTFWVGLLVGLGVGLGERARSRPPPPRLQSPSDAGP